MSDETSTTALTKSTLTTPSRLVDDPLDLDLEHLREILATQRRRGLVVGVVAGGIASGAAALLSSVFPLAALAMIPAFIVAFGIASVAARRAEAAQHGVTLRALGAMERAHRVAMRERMSMDVKDLTLDDIRERNEKVAVAVHEILRRNR